MDQTPAPQNFIYLLHHPESPHMYVGKTSKGMQRPQDHVHPSNLKRYAKLFRTKWIKSLLARGLKPEILVLEVCESPDQLDEAERFYIAYFRSIGASLANLTDGGDGFTGTHSREARVKMSETRKAMAAANPEATSAKLSEMAQNFWDDPVASAQERERRAHELRDKPRTPEVVAKISAGVRGKPKSPEHRAKIREAARLRWEDPAYRENQVVKQRATAQAKRDKRYGQRNDVYTPAPTSHAGASDPVYELSFGGGQV